MKIYLAGTKKISGAGEFWKTDIIEMLCSHCSTKYVFFDPFFDGTNMECELSDIIMDKREISESSILIAYIEKPTFGTTMEIFYAYSQQTKLVLIINPNKKYKHDPWLMHHSHKIFNNIHDCCWYILNNVKGN